jgi:hypothetical protein
VHRVDWRTSEAPDVSAIFVPLLVRSDVVTVDDDNDDDDDERDDDEADATRAQVRDRNRKRRRRASVAVVAEYACILCIRMYLIRASAEVQL